jgi:hypothetical protein
MTEDEKREITDVIRKSLYEQPFCEETELRIFAAIEPMIETMMVDARVNERTKIATFFETSRVK